MTKDRIIIFTIKEDEHSDDMVRTLNKMGREPIRLNTDDIPLNTQSSFRLDNDGWQGTIINLMNGRIIDIANIRSIWWRRPGNFNLSSDLSEQEAQFAKDELQHALDGLWASLDCYWVSFPAYMRQASWKLEQLKRASQLGFDVPRTLVTTDPEAAQEFYDVCRGQMIFKVMTDPFLGMTKTEISPEQSNLKLHRTLTTLVTKAQLATMNTNLLAPCMFQEYIPKQLELRVTIIGDEVFAAEIYSQESEQTKIDWRYYDFDITYRKADLKPEIAERCLTLIRSYNLNFSTMDLILTPDGRYVFLENNPNGQFIFIEKLIPELKMTEALASCLIRGTNS